MKSKPDTRTVGALLKLRKSNMLVANPEYQRGEVWTPAMQKRLLETPLSLVMIETNFANEARDLFIRLQGGMPLTAQEKRDAWPGNFTDFVLKIGGKPELPKYLGHDFFTKVMGAKVSKR